jgi:hypothetical protein
MRRTTSAFAVALMLAAAWATAAPAISVTVLRDPTGKPGDAFGRRVAISGTILIVGANGDDTRGTDAGSSLIYERDAGGVWRPKVRARLSVLREGDFFGWSVAVDGNVAVVGAPGDDTNDAGVAGPSTANRGAAYVLERIDGTWYWTTTLRGAGSVSGDEFGGRVAVRGDVILVSGIYHDWDPATPDAGRVWRFVRTASKWQPDLFLAGTPVASGRFGLGLGLESGRAWIGEPTSDTVHEFLDNGGLWQRGSVFRPVVSQPALGGLTGYSASLRGTRLAVGAPTAALDAAVPSTGIAWVLDRGPNGWDAGTPLVSQSALSTQRYGEAVTLTATGDVVVGAANGCTWTAPGVCTNPSAGTPAAQVTAPVRIFRKAGAWSEWVALPTNGILPGSGYGSALATDGDVLVVGAHESGFPNGPDIGNGVVFVYDLATLDGDGDTLPDLWELDFGLDATSSIGNDGASGDPDHDGRTNAEEHAAHTHPTAGVVMSQFFAEGATSSFFETEFAVANPGAAEAIVNLRFMRTGGTLASTVVRVPAQQSRKVRVGDVPGMAQAEFATQVESDHPVVVDRLMWWDRATRYGSHGERRADEFPVTSPPVRSTWYLAEGATHSGFELFYLLQNPSGADATVTITYLRPNGPPLEKAYGVPARSRVTVWVNQEEFPAGSGHRALASAEVAAIVETARFGPGGQPLPVWAPVVVERAMYRTRPGADLSVPGTVFEAGHASAGIPNPSASWFFAEGATGAFFDEFLLLANIEATPVTVTATYQLESGQTLTKAYPVAPRSRFTSWVDEEEIPAGSGIRPLADVRAVSVTLTGTQPFLAERAMWWPGPTYATWIEAHNSAGATTTATRWVAAAGEVRDTPRTDTYYLIANPGSQPAEVRVTLLFSDGSPAVARTFTVAPLSRFTTDVRTQFGVAGKGFGAVIESLGASPAPIVVEWAIYNDALGGFWAAGANALATPVP